MIGWKSMLFEEKKKMHEWTEIEMRFRQSQKFLALQNTVWDHFFQDYFN